MHITCLCKSISVPVSTRAHVEGSVFAETQVYFELAFVPANVGHPKEIPLSALVFNGPPLLGIWGYGLK